MPTSAPSKAPSTTPTIAPTFSPTAAPTVIALPGEPFVFENGNVTLNEKSQYYQVENVASCIIEYNEAGDKILNTSYIELYYDQINEFGNLTIGSFLLSNEFIVDKLPPNCTKIPAAKIVDIVINSDDSLIRLYVTSASVFEYVDEMSVNYTNTSYYLVGINDNTENIDALLEEEDIQVVDQVPGCILLFPNGTFSELLNGTSLCDNELSESIAETFGTIGNDISDNNNRRRRLNALRTRVNYYDPTFKRQLIDVDVAITWSGNWKCVVRAWGKCIVRSFISVPTGVGVTISDSKSVNRNLDFQTDRTFSGTLEVNNGDHSISGDWRVNAGFRMGLSVSGRLSFSYTRSFGASMIGYISSLARGNTGVIRDFLDDYLGAIGFDFQSRINLDLSGYSNFKFDGGYSFGTDIFDDNVDFTVYPGGVPVLITYGSAVSVGISVPFTSEIAAWVETGNIGISLGATFNAVTKDIDASGNFDFGNPQGSISGGLGDPVLDAQNLCLDATMVPELALKLYIRFDATIETSISHVIEAERRFEYPKACNGHNICQLPQGYRYFGVTTDYTLPVYLGWGLVADNWFTLWSTSEEVRRYDIVTTNECYQAPSELQNQLTQFEEGCCPPTRAPTKRPTYRPTDRPTDRPTYAGVDSTFYIVVTTRKNWQDANNYCISEYESTLATITNNDDNVALRGAVANAGLNSGEDVWIGYNDRNSEGSFSWVDGTSNSFTKWSGGEPNNSGEEDCVESWTSGGNWNDQKCDQSRYFVCNYPKYVGIRMAKNWNDANQYCKDSYGTTLATITNSNENIYVRNAVLHAGMASGDDVWIGYHDISSEGSFSWTDGASSGYTKWSSGEPNNSGNNEDCVESWSSDGNWNDLTCSSSRYFVCNYPKYMAVKLAKNWDDANTFCQATFGTSLATISSERENRMALYSGTALGLSISNSYWIGFNDHNSEASFSWIDGSSTSYTNWDSGEPNNSGEEDCTLMWKGNGKWNDDKCSLSKYFICNYKRQTPKAYYMIAINMNYWDANNYCSSNYGTSLATISNEIENEYIVHHALALGISSSNSIWIGYNDIWPEGSFSWVSGASNGYTNWNSGEPNNSGNEDCTELSLSSKKWNDQNCGDQRYFVCDSP